MPVSDELLEIIRCPLSHSRLELADESLLGRLRAAIVAGEVRNRAGDLVSRPAEGGLINTDGTLLYPIYDDIPDLIGDEAIPLDQIDAASNKSENADD